MSIAGVSFFFKEQVSKYLKVFVDAVDNTKVLVDGILDNLKNILTKLQEIPNKLLK